MADVNLTVRSVNNTNVTAYEQLFSTEKMFGVRPNQNANNGLTITEAGDTQSILSAWAISTGIGQEIFEGIVLYWTFQSTGTTRTIKIYGNSSRTWLLSEGSVVIANGNSGTCFFNGKNDHVLSGSVLITIGGGGATDDTDVANTLTLTNVTNVNDLQVYGETEFVAIENREMKTKYTVDETVAEIKAKAGLPEVYKVLFVVSEDQYTLISGAVVTFGNQTQVTNTDGEATFYIGNGTYAYIIEKSGYDDASGTVNVDGADIQVDVTMTT